MILIILGPQGSGKGTQAQILAEKLGLYCFDAGSFLRELAKKDLKINKIIDKGILVEDDIMFTLVTDFFEKNTKNLDNIIFDGYPRSVKQYKLLKNWLLEKGLSFNKAIFLDLSEEETIRRLSARRTCSACGRVYNLITNPPDGDFCECGGSLVQRDDDNPESIKNRLQYFWETTRPLINLLDEEGILIKIDGAKPIEAISQEILERLKS